MTESQYDLPYLGPDVPAMDDASSLVVCGMLMLILRVVLLILI